MKILNRDLTPKKENIHFKSNPNISHLMRKKIKNIKLEKKENQTSNQILTATKNITMKKYRMRLLRRHPNFSKIHFL